MTSAIYPKDVAEGLKDRGVWQESRNNQQLVLIRRLLLWPDEQ
ncbi:hypothetical protein X742_11445 [Mesorhizobium sp. LNHC232B00]|nr:hypothetical protein X742_11445 [Mesorhizobium sp. LNHC232B00]